VLQIFEGDLEDNREFIASEVDMDLRDTTDSDEKFEDVNAQAWICDMVRQILYDCGKTTSG
jgi:hypothetical protein